jgi:hypothetical protein
MSKEALSTDGQGNCLLGPITLHPVSTVDDEDCDDNHPKLDVKIISVNKDELKIYFSKDGGKTYYNENDPRIALRVPDADGTNSSGGSSSKGGKKGTNDRRRLVEATKARLQRKLACSKGETCSFFDISWCGWGLECRRYTWEGKDASFRCYQMQGKGEECDGDMHKRYGTAYKMCEKSDWCWNTSYLKCISDTESNKKEYEGTRGIGKCKCVHPENGDSDVSSCQAWDGGICK